MAVILDGKALADRILTDLAKTPCASSPKLLIVSVGDDPASEVYIRSKVKAAIRCGVYAVALKFPNDISGVVFENRIVQELEDEKFDGVIFQLPVPEHLRASVGWRLNNLPDLVDVDGLNTPNRGNWYRNKGQKPCTALGIMTLLEEYDIPLDGKDVCIIGRSRLVGRPLSEMMIGRNATVTLCHSHTKDVSKFTKSADIVVVAVGKPDFLTADMIKPGAVVIDVGINRVGTKIVGDCASDIFEKAGAYAPVPGGVGPMTVAMLMRNTYHSYIFSEKLTELSKISQQNAEQQARMERMYRSAMDSMSQYNDTAKNADGIMKGGESHEEV